MKIILGGGLTGLAASYRLSGRSVPSLVLERGGHPGGLARTFHSGGFRYDLGGHRLLTTNRWVEQLFRELLGEHLLEVERKSQILLGGRYFHYPLKPFNALRGFGVTTSLKILKDFLTEKTIGLYHQKPSFSLQDWVTRNFGRSLFEIYFRDYSEKVWGINCNEISSEWVAKRIQGVSLWKAIRTALTRMRKPQELTLSDRFYYPLGGIGELPQAILKASPHARVEINTEVVEIYHAKNRITGLTVMTPDGLRHIRGSGYVSTIPITTLLRSLRPVPPEDIMNEAQGVKYRDLIVVVVMLRQERVTDLHWLYIPEKRVPFGRIHEPGNWSPVMSPPGKTHLVVEFFTSRGEELWEMSDRALESLTTYHLETLGIIDREKVIGTETRRVSHAYPVFDLDYKKRINKINEYLSGFHNLILAGRTGGFEYLNMDEAILSGLDAAERLISAPRDDTHPCISCNPISRGEEIRL